MDNPEAIPTIINYLGYFLVTLHNLFPWSILVYAKVYHGTFWLGLLHLTIIISQTKEKVYFAAISYTKLYPR